MRYLWVIILFLAFYIPVFGAVQNSDLIINGGLEEVTLREGERLRLRLQDDLTKIPVYKGLHFQSTNPPVATVGKRNGIVRAHFAGKATILVTAADGDNASLQVTVESKNKGKASPLFFFLLLVITFILGIRLIT